MILVLETVFKTTWSRKKQTGHTHLISADTEHLFKVVMANTIRQKQWALVSARQTCAWVPTLWCTSPRRLQGGDVEESRAWHPLFLPAERQHMAETEEGRRAPSPGFYLRGGHRCLGAVSVVFRSLFRVIRHLIRKCKRRNHLSLF